MAPGIISETTTDVVPPSKIESSNVSNTASSSSYWAKHPKPSLFHRDLHSKPVVATSGSGHCLNLQNGSKIIDACGGAAVAALGNGNEEIVAAMTEQAKSLAYVHTQIYTTQSAEDLADLLVGHRPGGLSKAFFVGSGSEANDGAMKLARQYFYEKGEHQRIHYIARRQSYHGNTFGSMSISNNVPRLVPYVDILLPNVSHVSPCYAYQYSNPNETSAQYVARLAAELEAEFQRIGPEKVIAFVAETIGGATSGCIPPVPGYFPAVQEICRRHGALLILDEVMCGMGRTGTTFAWEQEEGIVPDILTIGKALGAGYAPIAGILVHQHIISTLSHGTGSFNHGQTYQQHPVSCAVALAVQRLIHRKNLIPHAAKMGRLLESTLKSKLGHLQFVGDIRGRGLFWAVEFVRDREGRMPFKEEVRFGPRVQQEAFELGVAVYPGHGTVDGRKGDHVLLAPPFDVTEEEIGVVVEVLVRAYERVVASVVGEV
ncbi:MAG: hypothetical protein M1834_001059 [Cirrosporium novae-zelandiae]|nr:MAG: hypothetical protein M1834_001059 [Cirrosporium novae-zelandiae]